MNQRFDTILKSGTVVNQDGEGIRDIGISDGRIAAIGGLLDLPFSLYRTFVLEERFGFNKSTPGLWVADHLKGWALGDRGFVAELEGRTDRRMTRGRAGRPISPKPRDPTS